MKIKMILGITVVFGMGFVIGGYFALEKKQSMQPSVNQTGSKVIEDIMTDQQSISEDLAIGDYIPIEIEGERSMKDTSISVPAFSTDFTIVATHGKLIAKTKGLENIQGVKYSPDCNKIVFSAGKPGKQDIWIFDLVKDSLQQLTFNPLDEIDPDWMSDGQRIVFSSNHTDTYELCIMDNQGRKKIQITRDTAIDKRHPHCSPIPWRNESWNDRETICTKSYTILYQGSDKQGNNDIWMIGEKGELATNISKSLPYAGNASFPAWAPNGQTMVYNVESLEKVQVYEGWNLYHQTQLLPNQIKAYFPQYLPNQTKITYMKNFVDDKIYYATLNGDNEKTLQLQGKVNGPGTWSADGKSLAYANQQGLYIQDVQYPLQNVLNAWQYPEIKPSQFAMLKKNHFVVTGDEKNLFHLWYEMSRYPFVKGYKIPVFVTVDAVLELFHLFYDYNLRHLEETIIYEQLCRLVEQIKNVLTRARIGQGMPSEYRSNLIMWEKYFEVAKILLEDVEGATETDVENKQGQWHTGEYVDELKMKDNMIDVDAYTDDPVIQAELMQIYQHQGMAKSKLLDRKINYSQFTVRGHYVDSPRLKAYFRTMSWLGLFTFNQPPDENENKAGLQRLLALSVVLGQDSSIIEQWKTVYNAVTFFVGEPEDMILPQIFKIQKDSSILDAQDLEDEVKIAKAMVQLKQIPKPKIVPKTGVCFSIFPQRFTIDSYIHQSLIFTRNGNQVGTAEKPRLFPKGLDIFASFGSERAYSILDKQLLETSYKNYPEIMRELKQEFATVPDSRWWYNSYWGWLYTLNSILEPADASLPFFMQNEAWADKSLVTALASWTELRHDTILYVKQVVAEGGEGGEGWEPIIPEPKGYVEPNVEFFQRLQKLISMNMKELKTTKRLKSDVMEKAGKFLEIVEKLEAIAVKERFQTPLSPDDYNFLFDFGTELEYLTAFYKGGPIPFYAGRTALVADVSAYKETYLHAAVGNVRAMLVTVPVDGKLQINRGAVFTYYEFLEAGKRLTDQEWRKMLDDKKAPALPSWTESFIAE